MPIRPQGSRFYDPEYAASLGGALSGLVGPMGVMEGSIIGPARNKLPILTSIARDMPEHARSAESFYNELSPLLEPYNSVTMKQLMNPSFKLPPEVLDEISRMSNIISTYIQNLHAFLR
jgi:hypothetical protein